MMEKKHKNRLQAKFANVIDSNVIVLDIPDDYQFMDPELVEFLEDAVAPYL